jgi:HlyD family secretion protein
MRTKLNKIKRIIKKPIFAIPTALIIIIVIFFIAGNGGPQQIEFVVAGRQDVSQEVSITGRVKAAEDVDLSFEQTGIVANTPVNVGDFVAKEQVLVSLRNSDVLAQVNYARAALSAEQAKLEELLSNTEIEQNLTNSYANVINTLTDSFATVENSVRIETNALFDGNKYTGYRISFTCPSKASNDLLNLKDEIETDLNLWRSELGGLSDSSPRGELYSGLITGQSHLILARDFIDQAMNVLTTSCALDISDFDDDRTNVSAARTNILMAVDSLNTLKQNIDLQKTTIATEREIQVQEASVKSAEANVQSYAAKLEKTIIRSPINGTVTRQDARIGESVTTNSPIVSVMSESNLEIESYIPEVDITKVKIGDNAKITLDAYGDETIFEAGVVKIDPAETVIEGVSTYKTIMQFVAEDERIKSGMTANIDILTGKSTNVIAIPARAVITKGNEKIVRIMEKDNIKEVQVKTGLRGSDGNVEIISGINEGDKVVTLIP